METTLIATYNERTLIFDNDLPFKPLSKFKVKIDIPTEEKLYSFLDTALNQDFDAPSDWSEKVDEYLYKV